MSEIIRILNSSYTDEILTIICKTIKNNKIVIMPSDTIYGFLCLKANEKRLRLLKKRDEKPFLYLISGISELNKLNVDHQRYVEVLSRYWPGRITFIMEDLNKKTVGVRFPDWVVLKEIILRSGEPLISTSVNYSGMNPIKDIDEIIKEFATKVDLTVIDENFKIHGSSTIVDLTQNPFKVIRKGSVEFNP